MNSTVQEKIELSAVLNLIPYLDTNFNYSGEVTLAKLVREQEKKFIDDNGELNPTFKILKTAIEKNPEFGKVVLVNQSSTNSTNNWKDDLIQGCTFRDPDGSYYVTYRGTGDGRWPDNADGMTALSTEMQEAAKDYFDAMAEKYFVEASAEGSLIFVTGHSKGGNEAQYVYMASEYEYLIDSCYSFDGQGFSGKARDHFMEKYDLSYLDDSTLVYFKDYSYEDGWDMYIGKRMVDSGVVSGYWNSNNSGEFYYYSDYNYDKDYGTLKFWDGKKSVTIADDVYYFTIREGRILYTTDYNDNRENCTLYIYDGKNSTKIADDVYSFDVLPDGRVLYLYDYSIKYHKGELYEWNGGKAKKIDDDVVYLFSLWH